ncbi:MAG TPA: tetratricopeptide repeat protein, partial [Ktedonobacterales bacterium]
MNDLEGAETVYTALLGFLRSQGWQDQVAEIERLMRETLGTEPPQPRRRRNTTASRPAGGNIPQRGGGRPRQPDSMGDTDGPADDDYAMPDPAASAPRQASQHMAAQAPMPPAAPPAPMPVEMSPTPGFGGMGDAFGVGASATFGSPGGYGMGGMDASFGMGGYNNGGMGMSGGLGPAPGLGALAGAAAYYSAVPPATAGDHLSQLISNLSGVGGMRSGINGLPEPQRAQVAQAVRDIENYVAHGLLTAAIEECLRVMEIAPQYLDVHLMLGEIYVRQGKIEQAIAKYAILIDTYTVNGRIDDAIATYRRILQLEPNNLTYRVKLIELLNRQGRTSEALDERLSAADSYMRLGYVDRAIQEYEQALLSSPNNTQVRMSYAAALMKAGRAQQAIGEYQRVLQVDSSNTLALSQWQIALATGVGAGPAVSMPGAGGSRVAALEVLGRLLRAMRGESMRNQDEIVRSYIQALDASPSNPDLRYALGQVYLAAGRQQEAVTCFQQAAAAPGFEVMARYAAGQAYLLTGDTSSAASAVRELEEAAAAARRTPIDPATWAARPRSDGEEHLAPEMEVSTLLARAYQLSGQVAQMQSTIQAVKDQRPVNNEVYQALAEVSARQGDAQSALQEYGQLVRTYRNNRQVENAVTVLKEMARLAPDDPAVRSELADIHISRGLLDEGMAELRHLADIHMRRGQLKDAAQVYQRMAEINWGMENRNEALNLLRQGIQYSTDDMALR